MLPYWLMFLVPALAALAADRDGRRPDGTAPKRRLTLAWIAAGVLLALAVGYRYEVGGDWFTYLGYLDMVAGAPVSEVLSLPDPGYMLLNWIAVKLGWDIVGVNALGAVIFSVGIVQFCRSLPRPWLGLAIAIPYLVIVVGMGYSRQGIALSLALLGLLAFQRGSLFWFFAWVVVGATFHKTAVLLLPIAALASSRNRWWTLAWAAVVTAAGYVLFLAESMESLYESYIEAEYQSEGVLIRLLMNALPALLLLLLTKRFPFRPAEASLWRWFALISLVLLGVLYVTSASTAVDRIALYMLPLQVVVFSYLPSALAPRDRRTQVSIVCAVIAYYTAVLAIWLFFATHAKYWLPYRFYLWEALT
jgi:hypothetical protein